MKTYTAFFHKKIPNWKQGHKEIGGELRDIESVLEVFDDFKVKSRMVGPTEGRIEVEIGGNTKVNSYINHGYSFTIVASNKRLNEGLIDALKEIYSNKILA